MKKRITLLALLASLACAASAQVGSTPTKSGPLRPGNPGVFNPNPMPTPIAPAPRPIKFGDRKTPKPTPRPPIFNYAPQLGVPPDSSKLVWRRGSSLEACSKTGSCIRRALPKQTGKPIAITRGRFLDERLAPVSAIVVSNRRYSLCYLPTLKNTAAFECFPIKAPIIKGGRIKAIENPKLKTYLDITIEDKYLKLMMPGEAQAATTSFLRALAEAQARATKVLSQRAIRQTAINAAAKKRGTQAAGSKKTALPGLQQPMLVDSGGGGSYCDDGYCTGGGGDSGGGGYWPDEVPLPDDGSGGVWGPEWGETFPDGSADGGGYPDTPDAVPVPGPGIPIPVPPIVTPGSGWNCWGQPGAQICEGKYPRPDPNTTDPETGQQLPPSQPATSICDYAPFSWVCGWFEPAPAPVPPPPLEVIDPPARPDPITRDAWEEKQYQMDLDDCDGDRKRDEDQLCGLRYTLHGGSVYDDMVEQGVRLTPGERKQLKEAKTEYSACLKKVAQEWSNCRDRAAAKWP